MQNFRTKARASSGFFSGKKVAACMLSVAVAAVIFWGITLTGNTEHSDEQMTVAQALRAAGDTLSANADPTKFTGGISSRVKMMELEDQGQAPSDDEAEQEAEDVQALLKEDEEIVTGKFLGASQRGGSTLETKTVVEEEVIAYPVQQRETSLLDPGEQKLIQSGVNGKKTVTYEQRIVNGELRSQKAVEETVTQQPVPEIVLVGVAGKAVSPLDFDVELDEQGIPTQYTQLLTNQVATGYNVGSSAMGASGQGLSAGYVAVHPGEIPYGTRMYITSADNSFVYGFAIAADTGLGLLGDVIDVDLYYDTYLESCLNGKRNVNIYFLD